MIFKIFRRLLTGEVLHTIQASLSNGASTLRLKLKRERHSGELYFAVSLTSFGNGNFQYMSAEEFNQFVGAILRIKGILDAAQAARPK